MTGFWTSSSEIGTDTSITTAGHPTWMLLLSPRKRISDALEPQLTGLPRIPIDDQGGTGGYASLHVEAEMSGDERSVVEVIFPEPAMVDEVALVPSRRYDASGLDSQYGMPDRFTVEPMRE